jgi:hypothetical protein
MASALLWRRLMTTCWICPASSREARHRPEIGLHGHRTGTDHPEQVDGDADDIAEVGLGPLLGAAAEPPEVLHQPVDPGHPVESGRLEREHALHQRGQARMRPARPLHLAPDQVGKVRQFRQRGLR